MSNINFLGISGSLHRHSTNYGLLRAARSNLPDDVSMAIADLSDIPFYNADLTKKPAGVVRFLDQLKAVDALVLACPEYNYSIAPALKNALDWASREANNAYLAGKPVAIMGAGGGMDTSRAQYHLRQVCVFLDMHPLNKPEIFSNAFSGGFDADGNVIDTDLIARIGEQMRALSAWTSRLKPLGNAGTDSRKAKNRNLLIV